MDIHHSARSEFNYIANLIQKVLNEVKGIKIINLVLDTDYVSFEFYHKISGLFGSTTYIYSIEIELKKFRGKDYIHCTVGKIQNNKLPKDLKIGCELLFDQIMSIIASFIGIEAEPVGNFKYLSVYGTGLSSICKQYEQEEYSQDYLTF